MPYFFPSLPYIRRESPFRSFVGGLGAAQDIQRSALQSQAIRAGLEDRRERKGALQEYQTTGDIKSLIPAMSPDQAAQIPAQQVQTAVRALGFLDSIGERMTPENYPALREEAMKQFPDLAEKYFPSPDQLSTPDAFNNWWDSIYKRAAMLKALPQIISAQAQDRRTQFIRESVERVARQNRVARTAGAAGRAAATPFRVFYNDMKARFPQMSDAEIVQKFYGQTSEAKKPPTYKTVLKFDEYVKENNLGNLSPQEQRSRYNDYVQKSKQDPLARKLLESIEGDKGPGEGGGAAPSMGGPYFLRNKQGRAVEVDRNTWLKYGGAEMLKKGGSSGSTW